MAKVLKDFNFGSAGKRGRPALYPWGEWLDGQVRRIEPGKDFGCTAATMLTQIYNKSKALDGKAHVHVEKKDDGEAKAIVFKFYRPACNDFSCETAVEVKV